MAERRMFTKKIVDSDAFLDMPLSSQALYFHLSMRADDEGFINNPKKIQRMIGASDDDMKVLVAKRFIIVFESGVIVIKHWKMHNYIQGDRFHPTDYKDERRQLYVKDNKAYSLVEPEDVEISTLYPKRIQNASNMDTEDRLGKDRLGKDSIDSIKDTIRPSKEGHRTEMQTIIDAWNELPVTNIHTLNPGTNRYKMVKARLSQYGIDAVLEAINLVSQSPFLLGRKTEFVITFDWFIRPNNFIKVYEGNYSDRQTPTKSSERLGWLDELQRVHEMRETDESSMDRSEVPT